MENSHESDENQKRREGDHLQKAIAILSSPPKNIHGRKLLTQVAIVEYLNDKGVRIAIPTFDNYKNIAVDITKLSKYQEINIILDHVIKDNYRLQWNETDNVFEAISLHPNTEFSDQELQGLNGLWEFYTWCNIKFRGTRTGSKGTGEPLLNGYHIHVNKMRITEGRDIEFVSEFSHFHGYIGVIPNTKKFYIEMTSVKRDRMVFFTGEILLPQDQTLDDLEGLTAAYTDSGVPGVTCGVAVFLRSHGIAFEKMEAGSKTANKIKNKKIVDFLKGTLNEYGTQYAVPAYEHSQFVEPKRSKRIQKED